MEKRDFLLEIGLEELPARFVTSSMEQLTTKVQNWLQDKNIGYENISSYATPRRLAVLIHGLDEAQADINEEAKGPAKKIALDAEGNWSKAAQGFVRGQKMTVEDIFFKEIGNVEYACVNKFVKGQPTSELLPELKDLITSMTFGKFMRWAAYDLRFVRPIKWIVALFGSEVIPFEITNVQTNNKTRGHRFLGTEVELSSASEYQSTLLGQYVLANPVERKSAIVSQINNLSEENNWVIPMDESLLEEVTNLVEYPTVLFGKFEEEFLNIPEEVLITSMKEHQRYFPVKSKEGKLLPFFVTVRNGDHNHLGQVARGNEKVLRARLSDADFFYKEDQKTSIETSLAKLEKIVYHEEIGTLSSKVARVRQLATTIASMMNVSQEDSTTIDRAATICKFDLVTNMVNEFPELQGFMGEKYAIQKGETVEVAKSINEHYMPRNAQDDVASSLPGAILAIADKMDTIASFFAIGMIPSGSQDPYALRRQAQGIVTTLWKKELPITLEQLVDASLQLIETANFAKKSIDEIKAELISFFILRLKHVLTEEQIRYDLIDALLDGSIGQVSKLMEKASVLEAAKDDSDFKESMENLSRVINISTKATTVVEVDPSLFENDSEVKLYEKFNEVQEKMITSLTTEQQYRTILTMKDAIVSYFENTMVMATDEKVKTNRLSMMMKIAQLINQFANVTKIVVK